MSSIKTPLCNFALFYHFGDEGLIKINTFNQNGSKGNIIKNIIVNYNDFLN